MMRNNGMDRKAVSRAAAVAAAMLVAMPGWCADTVMLSGADWSIHEGSEGMEAAPTPGEVEAAREGWIPAGVPGNIQADLEAAHLLEPLSYGVGDPRLAEVARKNWWYRKEFRAPERFRGKRVQLVFDGVDFGFDVWLNGRHLGHRAGQFRRFAFEAEEALRVGGMNRLEVRIERMPAELEAYLSRSDGAWSGQLVKPFLFHTNDAPYFFVNGFVMMRRLLKDLKSPTNFGWDWGVNIYTLGIWRDVKLEATGGSRIDWVQVQTAWDAGADAARIKVRLETDSRRRAEVEARIHIDGHRADVGGRVRAVLAPGRGRMETEIELKHPELWWPNGQGTQPLYALRAELRDAASGQELDTHSVRFGVREVRWEQVEGAPADFINPYQLVVNGRPIRMMGSNVIPPDLLFGRIGTRTDRLLEMAHDAGMNTIRVWGGGVILPDEFYDRADELGILLSQEFPLANSWPETDPVFLSNLSETITGIVKRLRNHPSVIEWVGGNEMPWEQGTDQAAMHVLERVCAEQDTRIFRATDPMQGSRHSPWDFTARTHYTHYNHQVLERFPLAATSGAKNTLNAMRYGEFGTETPANLEAIVRDIPPASRWPLENLDDPVLIRKNVVQAVFSSDFWLKKPTIEELFGPVDDLEQLVRAGQFVGAESLRYAFDELRRKGKRIGGMTSWDFNEPWPNGAGSFQVDYDGRPLMNYGFVRQALAPVSLALRYDSILYDPAVGVRAELWLTSDAPEEVRDAQWRWVARDRRGRVIGGEEGKASITPREARRLRSVQTKPPEETGLGPVFVELSLRDARGGLLSERLHVLGADNAHIWPLDGLLRNEGQEEGDTALLHAAGRVVQVLFLYDHDVELYRNLGWTLRRFGIHADFVPATVEAVGEALASPGAAGKKYDVIWFGDGDYEKSRPVGERLGAAGLQKIAQAVRDGMGIGFEGGWGAYPAAGLQTGPLGAVLPVSFSGGDERKWEGTSGVRPGQDAHAITAGRLLARRPKVTASNVVRAKPGAWVVLRTDSGEDLLVASETGKGRVLAFASSVVGDGASHLRQWSGYPFLMARMFTWLARGSDAEVAAIDLPAAGKRVVRPVRRTSVGVTAGPVRVHDGHEYLQLRLVNHGEMTALFCEPRPEVEYRTDLRISNNHAFVPPGETRTLTIAAKVAAGGSLGLAQEGWLVSCWNSDDARVPLDESVLLAAGRRDAMSQEFGGMDGPLRAWKSAGSSTLEFRGVRPEAGRIPLLLPGEGWNATGNGEAPAVRFIFAATAQQAARASRLRIDAADQDAQAGAALEVRVNGRVWKTELGKGLGKQMEEPAHLAFPARAEFALPAGTWKAGENTVEVRVRGRGWFTWDGLVLATEAAPPATKRN